MRKLIVFNLITLDGYFEGPNREIDWHNVDGEFNEFAIDQLDKADLLIFGRVTYELMANYWPTEAAIKDDPVVAGKMNSIQKLVFSRKFEKADWNNTRLVKDAIETEIKKLKQEPGKDMYIFGSNMIVSYLTDRGMIDEYRLMINPVVLGKGNSMFSSIRGKHKFKLKMTKVFNNGNVLLYYGNDLE